MASRYWVGGTGNWNDTAHWSATSGGASGVSVPGTSDDVFFDANSAAATYTVTIDVNPSMLSITTADPATGTLTIAHSGRSWTIAGSMTFHSTLVISGGSNAITFTSTTTGCTVTTGGQVLQAHVTFDGVGGGWTLQDSLQTTDAASGNRNVTLTNGSLDTNGQAVTCGSFISSNSNTRTLTLGASVITIKANGDWDFATTTGLTFNVGTSSIRFDNTPGWEFSFNGGGLTYNDVQVLIPGNGGMTMTGANTFATLSFSGTTVKDVYLSLGANQTITGTLTIDPGDARYSYHVRSDTLGTARTLTAAAVSLSDVDFQDITGAGAASPFTGTRLGDCKGNSGITTTTPKTTYVVTATGSGINSNDPASWAALTSGGATAAANRPLPQDSVVLDSNSFTGAGTSFVINDQERWKGINTTACSKDITFSTSTDYLIVYGDMTFKAGDSFGLECRYEGRTTQQLTPPAGPGNFQSNTKITAPSTTLSLLGDLAMTNQTFSVVRGITVDYGTLTTNDYNIVCGTFVSNTTNTRALNLGRSRIVVYSAGTSWDLSPSTGLTADMTKSTIVWTGSAGKTFDGGDQAYGTLQVQPTSGTANHDIKGSNSFKSVIWENGFGTLRFENGKTHTVDRFEARGSSGNHLTAGSIAAATHSLVKATSRELDLRYVDMSNSTGSGATFNSYGGTDGGSNTSWAFPAAPSEFAYRNSMLLY